MARKRSTIRGSQRSGMYPGRVSISTRQPSASAPARSARSTLRSASAMASSDLPRTNVSSRTSPGMTFTCEPPWVMIGCTRMVSSSRNVSRIALMAMRPIWAA